MSEEVITEKKISLKKIIAVILAVVLTTGIISCFTLYREHKMRRAVVGVEGLSFDGMEFQRCSDYVLTNTFDVSEKICKSEDGGWTIRTVEGYEDNLEYVYARSNFDGFFYEKIN